MLYHRAFTMAELMVTISIFGILAAASFPVYTFFQTENVLLVTKQEVIEQLRFAQQRARAGYGNSAHGVYFQTSSYTIFQGGSYASRVQSQDLDFTIDSAVELSNLTEVQFSQTTGLPNASGQLILTNPNSNDTLTIDISSNGLFE